MKAAITLLVFCVAGLLSLGMVMLYSSGMAKEGAHYLVMQLLWGALGLVACVVAVTVDYRWLKKFAWVLYALAVVLVALVFVPHLGVHKNGATRWLGHGRVSLFQPSEFAKLALLVGLAWYGERYQRQMPTWKRGILVPGIFVGLLLGLIFIEPDRGTTVLLASVSAVVLLVAGVRWKYFVPPVIAALAALGFSLWHDPMRSKRIFSWLYLEESKSGVGYQAYQAMLALGAGGWTGLGLGNGRQKLGFVPEHHTDFIFSIIGEELGLIATLLVVLGFVVIVLCGIYIAIHARDAFGLLLGTGITFLVGMQAFINIGVVTSALPNKGLPLPFISYGGSSLLVMLTAIGVLLSIARQARQPEAVKAGLPEGEPA
ncbi:MAG TPA: putative lipid II flippase FtsW [Methylomirabilota bacterium]|jgi:cell division protein FtsW|nr:putative lipid II flippase FtsW [Methylomirabilota bacterium]